MLQNLGLATSEHLEQQPKRARKAYVQKYGPVDPKGTKWPAEESEESAASPCEYDE